MFSFRSQGPTIRQQRNRSRALLQIEQLERRDVMATSVWDVAGGIIDTSQSFLLHSNPTAKHVVYLDFNGHTTGNVYGSSWDNLTSPAWDYSGNGASFTTTELQIIQKIWARVAEDFAPFNIDITTQDPGVDALIKSGTTDDRWGVRVVITPDDRPAPGSGGVAYLTSFNFNTDTPAYVFNTSEKSVAEAATHEVGHALGLNHDGTATLGYYPGHGSGATSWGPIMGASYNPIVTQWSKGEYSGATNKEDDLAKITTNNGFTYRSDDYGSTQATAFSLLPQGSAQVSPRYGIIERNTDSDWFSFYANAGNVALNVDPLTLGPNLAVRADLYNASGTLLATFNPAGALNAAVNFNVPSAGQYFLKVSGTGKGDPLSNGFSNYASLGNYRITGTVQAYTGGGGGGGEVNLAPTANNDSTSTAYGTAVSVNVLANDTDPENDTLTITNVSGAQGGTASIVAGAVLFTPTTGFSGTGSFTYTISDGNGHSATATASVTVAAAAVTSVSFTNSTDVAISTSSTGTYTSRIVVSGVAGTLQDVDVRISAFHTYDSDLIITLIAPDGSRTTLFNRHGGSGDNLLNTTFNDSATTRISSGSAPFSGSYRPYQSLTGLNGKSANGTWTLEIRDYDRRDGGYLDNWSLDLRAAGTAPAAPGRVVSGASGSGFTFAAPSTQPQTSTLFDAVQAFWSFSRIGGVTGSSGSHTNNEGSTHHHDDFLPEADLPPAPEL